MPTTTPPSVGASDPSILRSIERNTAQQNIIAGRQSTVVSGSETIYNQATAATSQTASAGTLTVTQTANNESGDIVTVYSSPTTIAVTAIDQTINNYKGVGPTGPTGPAGSIGPIGPTGPAGAGGGASYIVNGVSNIALPTSGGDATANIGGVANVLVLKPTGANITGVLGITGNIAAGNANLGNAVIANFFIGDGGLLTNLAASGTYIANGTTNVAVLSSGSDVTANVGGSANVLVLKSTGANITGTLGITGNANAGNIGATTGVFTNISGTLTTASQTNITAVGTLGSLAVTGNANVGNLGTAGLLVATGNITGGNLVTAGSLNATGNANAGNIGATTGVFTNISGTLTTASQTNITAVGTLGSLAVTGNISGGNANLGNSVTANFFVGDGGLLTNIAGASGSYISNGTTNVAIAISSGNVTANVGGVSNVMTLTTTGGNITGNLGVTANISANNASIANYVVVGSASGGTLQGANLVSANFIAGTLTTSSNAQPNITSIGTLSNLTVTGNVTANFFLGDGGLLTNIAAGGSGSFISNGTTNVAIISSGGNVTANVGGTPNAMVLTSTDANFSGNIWAGSNLQLGSNTFGVAVSSILADQAFSVLAHTNGSGYLVTGYAQDPSIPAAYSKALINYNITPETVQIQTGNVFGAGAHAWDFNNTGDFIVAGNISNGNIVTANFFVGDGGLLTNIAGSSGSFISNGTTNVAIISSGGNVTANVGGTANVLVLTATGANITGTLNATGNANTGNIGATTGVFTNVSGTLTTASQTNITAVGTLGSLSVTGNTTSGNFIGRLANGTSNVSIPTASGNVNTSVGGTSNVLVVTSTGANISGNLDVTNTVTISGGTGGNITGANYIYANFFVGSLANGTSNVNIPTSSGNITVGASGNSNIVVVTGTGVNIAGTLNATGNANTGNIGATTGVFTNISGTLTTASQTNITAVGTLGSLSVTGNANTGNIGATNGVFTGAITGSTTLNITGNANVGNLGTSGNITAGYFFGNGSQLTGISAGTASSIANGTSNVTIPVASGNVITSVGGTSNVLVVTSNGISVTGGGGGQITGANLVSANFFTGTFANGTSNIAIPASGGNINLTAGGTTSLVVTSTGANITGTLNATGNANTGNIGATTGVFTNISGTLTTASQTNITAVGTLGSLSVTGNTTSGNFIGRLANGTSNVSMPTAGGNVNISAGGTSNVVTVTSTGANIAGTLNVTGNATTANVTITDTLTVSAGSGGNITGANYIYANFFVGSLANGTSNVNIPASSGNITVGASGNSNVVVVTGTGVNIAGTLNATGNINGNALNIASGSGGSISGANIVSANFFSGVFTTSSNAQPNITSVGTLANLITTGNLTWAANLAQQGGTPVSATDTTIAYKIPIVINGTTYYIALTAAV